MSRRYIDADLLQEDFKEAHNGKRSLMIDVQPSADVVEVDKAQKEIDYWHDRAQSYEQTILKLSLNKADVVEVVRCKDCKHNHCELVAGEECWLCGLGHEGHKIDRQDFYCADGERAEEC